MAKCTIVEIDLEKTISQEVLAKLWYLCKKRKLQFPEGIVTLIREVCENNSRDDSVSVSLKKHSRPRHSISTKKVS